MEIYPDIIFLENIVMNYLILLLTAKFAKSRTSHLRLLFGALIGASYVLLMIFLPGIKVYYSMLAKIILSFAIVAVAFYPEKIKAFLKILAIFYISTFIFAGAAFAFLYLNQSGGFIRNGIVFVFWQSKWSVLILTVITVGIIARVFWEILQYKFTKEQLLRHLKISFEKRFVNLDALVDTGNSLHDPLTNTPVVIVEFRAIKEILPGEIRNIFEESKENDLISVTTIISGSEWFSRFRLIPFTSLGKENGMLIGFKPDYIEIGENEEKKDVVDVIVGIYNRALSKNERYRALLSPELM